MRPARKALHWCGRGALALLSTALVGGTAVPLFRGNEWWIRLFDFPRIQVAWLLTLALGSYAVRRERGRLRRWEYALAAMVGTALTMQVAILAPYTVFHPRQLASSRLDERAGRLSLLVHNVLADNRDVTALRDLIRASDPDIILLTEPTRWWREQLGGLASDYPYTLVQPLENQYGMLFYSRLPLENPEIRFLIEPDIPSIRTRVRLGSGTVVTLYGVHPRPPGPKEKGGAHDAGEREDSDVRDAELLTIAREVGELGDSPVIVAGDFNDVPWSHTIDQFQRLGGLLDPRVGRGMVTTFPTGSPLLRYPLDHVFASRHFRVVELRRFDDIGSDHFPLLVVLDYDPDPPVAREAPQRERPRS